MSTKSELTREKILTAALHEFSLHGLAGARVDTIAETAGINKAMIYYHFESKEALFKELFKAEMELLNQEITSLFEQRDPRVEADRTLAVKDLLAYIGSKKKLLSVLISETSRYGAHFPYLFQLLDVTTAFGVETAKKAGIRLKETEEPLLHELLSGLLPLIYYVLLREEMRDYYGWDDATMDDRFIAYWLRNHGSY